MIAYVLALLALLLAAPTATGRAHQGRAHHKSHTHHKRRHHHKVRQALDPIIFVHGFDGSGAQFESQQMRLTSNGYPQSFIGVFEYDSSQFAGAIAGGGISSAQEAPLFAQLDQQIAQMKRATHRPKVDLLAHSLGTFLTQDYLNSSPQRAANVAHYVNIDGRTANGPPGGVPTLALWATKGPLSPPGRSVKGAKNVSIPDSTHVQCATSSLSFARFYKFFTGKSPKTTNIVTQKGRITLAGRAVNFPQNTGLKGASVQVWQINQATGQRTGSAPIATLSLGDTGNWGPVTVRSGSRYEFALVRTDNPTAPLHHFYYEPFTHSDHLVRLLESDALRSAGGIPDPFSVAMVIVRYKELWGDQGSQSDVLTVDGVNVCGSTTCPLNKEVNGLFVADFDHDRAQNDNETWPTYQNLGYFISSADVFIPAQNPPTGEVTIGLKSRGQGPTRTLSLPNFEGTSDDVTVQLNDYG